MTQDKKFLGTEPVGRLLWRLAVPTVIAQLVNMLYNIVDRIYIGHIPETGSMALTGVGVCLPIIMIISAFAAFVSSGGAPRASIAMGRGDYDQAQRILGGCFTLQVAISLVLTAVLLIWNRTLLLAFGASGNTIEYAAQYMGVYALGTLFVELTLGLNAFITAQGFAQVGMKTVLIGAVANILLDPLFIFALGMGVHGAVPGHLLRVGNLLPAGKKDPAAAGKGRPAHPAPADPALRGPGYGGVHHAGQRKRHLRVLQRLPAEIRRGPGSGGHDHPVQRDAVRHAAPSGHRPGGPAHLQL